MKHSDSNYEEFQQRIFNELEELEWADRKSVIANFVEIGRRAGVDVVKEILDNGKSVSEVFDAIRKGLHRS